ncbi:MAG TPA: DUF4440 domain-containing protein [Terriglobales bacterium]|nr:DUF4440 domain-containing protein [Terriglobales bacterium]
MRRDQTLSSILKLPLSLLLMLLMVSGCTIWKEPKVATWKNTTSLEAMERLMWQEVKAGNWLEVEGHLASNFKNTTPAGVLDKAQTLAEWKKQSGNDFSLGEFLVTDNGETAVVTYTASVSGAGAGAASGAASGSGMGKGMQFRVMSVWQKQKSGWLMIAQSHAPVV